jgi:hypothetical protein
MARVGVRSAAYHLAMRRPRPHQFRGSARRLLAVALLGGLAAAVAVSAASGTVSAAGLRGNLTAGPLKLPLPLGLPSLGPLPGTTSPASASPSLPGGAIVPPLCAPACTSPTGGGGPSGGAGDAAPGGAGSNSPLGPGSHAGGGSGPVSAAPGTVSAPQSVGLSVGPPLPVEQLTPLAGISFGQAPYVWPLFLILDVIAAAAVALLVRRNWSHSAHAD